MTWNVRVAAEEVITSWTDGNNGAGPLWCFGSRTIAREGGDVFAVTTDTGKDVAPLCNTRWQLFGRKEGGSWSLCQSGAGFDEREPCPMVMLPGRRIAISTNPCIQRGAPGRDGRSGGVCEPRILIVPADDPSAPPVVERPRWNAAYRFFEHSYRGFGTDAATGAILLTHQVADGSTYNQAWSYRDEQGQWSACGILRFPVRGCYPMIALRGKQAVVVAVSDIDEPNPEWRAVKREATGKDWDYDFRQIFFTWTPDIGKVDFSLPLTIASRDETCGSTVQHDLWIGPDGDAHVVFNDLNIWHRPIRDACFPRQRMTQAVRYCRIRTGSVIERRTFMEATEVASLRIPTGKDGKPMPGASSFYTRDPRPHSPVLHATPDGELYAIWSTARSTRGGKVARGLAVRRVLPWDEEGVREIKMKAPLSDFLNACGRAGTGASQTIDLYGHTPDPKIIRYVQMRIEK